ncbi:MAG: phosphomethylpyrimidine synthase ThiC, partial [Candidatus Omnitrophota bacterium]
MTQLESAKKNIQTAETAYVAEKERQELSYIINEVANGRIVIPKNTGHNIKRLCGIGNGLTTKVNANIGTSDEHPDIAKELEKLKTAIDAGADTIMDLSVGGGLRSVLKNVIEVSDVPVGTVPIYEVATNVLRRGVISDMSWSDIEPILEWQARIGVDFFTIHSGVTREIVEFLKK